MNPNKMSTRALLEYLVKKVKCCSENNSGPGGPETDPVFTVSPAHDITNGHITFLNSLDYNTLNNKPDLTTKADLVGGKVPANQLPSYVDDVIEAVNIAAFPAIGEQGKLYIALDTNKIYRWSGSVYVDMTPGEADTFQSVTTRNPVTTNSVTVAGIKATALQGDASYTKQVIAKPDGTFGWEDKTSLTTLGGMLPTVRILDYTQDATNYMLRVSYTYGQAAPALPLFEVRIHSAQLLAQNITTTGDSVNQSTSSTQNGISINGFVTTILIPKATNASPIWNNDIAGIMVRLVGVDNGDGGIASTKLVRRTVADMALIGTIRPKQDLLVSGTNIKTVNGSSLLGSGNLIITSPKNEAGQVKVNYTGLSITGFTNNTSKQFNINGATPTVVTSPTTKYPNSTPNSYTGFFDSARNGGTTTFQGRLIENPIQGQPHRFRIQGTYANKANNNTGALDIILRNPVSGFISTKSITLPTGRVSGSFDEVVLLIADNNSIVSPNGYILEAQTSFTDTNLTINISSITRFSDAIEP